MYIKLFFTIVIYADRLKRKNNNKRFTCIMNAFKKNDRSFSLTVCTVYVPIVAPAFKTVKNKKK